jgi:hypothetical protein
VAKSLSGWEAAFYHDSDGRKPVKEFLEDLEKSDPDQANTVYNKFDIFRERGWNDSLKSGLLKIALAERLREDWFERFDG